MIYFVIVTFTTSTITSVCPSIRHSMSHTLAFHHVVLQAHFQHVARQDKNELHTINIKTTL